GPQRVGISGQAHPRLGALQHARRAVRGDTTRRGGRRLLHEPRLSRQRRALLGVARGRIRKRQAIRRWAERLGVGGSATGGRLDLTGRSDGEEQTMSFVTRGFRGRRRDDGPEGRVPPGQYVTADFPVLSAGPTPRIPLDTWSFTARDRDGTAKTWNWEEFQSLPSEKVTVDIHCVTKWSKLDTTWEGVSLDVLLADFDTSGGFALVRSFGHAPRIPLDTWSFTARDRDGTAKTWNWEEFQSLPSEKVTVDIHCVTKWSKLDTTWEGVSLDVLLADFDTSGGFALVRSYGDYTTNL